jgi:hypothetical protein
MVLGKSVPWKQMFSRLAVLTGYCEIRRWMISIHKIKMIRNVDLVKAGFFASLFTFRILENRQGKAD